MPDIYASCGDNLEILASLKIDGVVSEIDSQSTVVSVLVRNSLPSNSVASLIGDFGADWVNGIASIVFPVEITSLLIPGRYSLHVYVTINNKRRTWILKDAVELVKNFI